jgi:hypothetical protein
MVLISQPLRATSWSEPQAWSSVDRFELRNDVASSEVDATRIERWLGAEQRNLAGELEPESVAA